MAFFAERISNDTIAGWFDEVDQELTSIFTIQKEDGNLITIKESFKAYYLGRTCRYLKTEENHCNTKFHEIVHKSLFIFKQYKKYQEDILNRLQDFSQYQDEVKTNFDNSSDNTNTLNNRQDSTNVETRDLIDGHLTGASDAATMSTLRTKNPKYISTEKMLEPSTDKVLDILEPTSKNVTHSISKYKGTDTHRNNQTYTSNSTNKNINKGNSLVTSSNPFKDMITFMNIDIPDFRGKFLSNFRELFFLTF